MRKKKQKQDEFVLVRVTDKVRYLTKIRTEEIAETCKKHKLYRFEPQLYKAIKFTNLKVAFDIANKLKNVVVEKV